MPYTQFQRRVAELYEESRAYEDAMENYKYAIHFYKADVLTQEVRPEASASSDAGPFSP